MSEEKKPLYSYEEVQEFVCTKTDYYHKRWQWGKENSFGWNWAAAFLSSIWLLFRRVYYWAFIIVFIEAAKNILLFYLGINISLSWISDLIQLFYFVIVFILLGTYGNRLAFNEFENWKQQPKRLWLNRSYWSNILRVLIIFILIVIGIFFIDIILIYPGYVNHHKKIVPLDNEMSWLTSDLVPLNEQQFLFYHHTYDYPGMTDDDNGFGRRLLFFDQYGKVFSNQSFKDTDQATIYKQIFQIDQRIFIHDYNNEKAKDNPDRQDIVIYDLNDQSLKNISFPYFTKIIKAIKRDNYYVLYGYLKDGLLKQYVKLQVNEDGSLKQQEILKDLEGYDVDFLFYENKQYLLIEKDKMIQICDYEGNVIQEYDQELKFYRHYLLSHYELKSIKYDDNSIQCIHYQGDDLVKYSFPDNYKIQRVNVYNDIIYAAGIIKYDHFYQNKVFLAQFNSDFQLIKTDQYYLGYDFKGYFNFSFSKDSIIFVISPMEPVDLVGTYFMSIDIDSMKINKNTYQKKPVVEEMSNVFKFYNAVDD